MTTAKGLPPEYRPSARSILAVLEQATPTERDTGAAWYPSAHNLAGDLFADAGTGAGVIAALSPQSSWTRNVESARAVAAGARPRYASADMTRKVDLILEGRPWQEVLGGPKVRAFAQCIHNPWDGSTVVIDRHAFDIAVGAVTDDRVRGLLLRRKGVYAHLQRSYRAAARVVGEDPNTIQATTWVTWRRLKGLPE